MIFCKIKKIEKAGVIVSKPQKQESEKSKCECSKHEISVMEVCAVVITILSIGTFIVFVIAMISITTEIIAN